MGAFTFLCSKATEQECLDRLLFGTNPGWAYENYLCQVEVGDYLFLWNYETYVFRGPFRALTKCMANIEPNSWRNVPGHARGFPFQVRVGGNEEYANHLNADDLSRHGLLHATANFGLMPPVRLADDQLRQVLEMFRRTNGDNRPVVSVGGVPIVPGSEEVVSTAFIFKCDHATGGRCFADNIMGAPVQVFRPLVSNVQPGATIFLWQIEERKLYGMWKAMTRGQYDPTAFPEAAGRLLHAVVHCTRDLNVQNGIDETALRGIVPYDGPMPPYQIDQAQAEKLVDALLQANNEGDVILTEHRLQQGFLAEDGHWVKSQAELIIDNVLFSQRCVHAYEKRVQVGKRYLRCDFYLPTSERRREVYIEYWGMLDQAQYASRRQEKISIYSAAGIVPLELFPRDLAALAEVLPAKLSGYGNRPV